MVVAFPQHEGRQDKKYHRVSVALLVVHCNSKCKILIIMYIILLEREEFYITWSVSSSQLKGRNECYRVHLLSVVIKMNTITTGASHVEII